MNKLLIAVLVAGAWLTTAQAQLVCYRTYYSYPAYSYAYYPAPAYFTSSSMSSANSLFGR